MNKKSKFLLCSFSVLVVFLFMEVGYFYVSKSLYKDTQKVKKEFMQIVQLPDLSISTEATYVRHRSLSDFFAIYKDDATLREYFASTYVFSSSYMSRDEK